MHRKKQKTWAKHFDFILLDLLFIELSFVIAYVLRFGIDQLKFLFGGSSSVRSYHYIMLTILALHVAIVFFSKQYDNILKRNSAGEFVKVVRYNLTILIGIVLLLFMRKSSDEYSRIVVFLCPLIGLVLIFSYRYYYKKFLRTIVNRAGNQSCMLLIAPYSKASRLVNEFNSREISTSRIVGIILTKEDEINVDADREIAATGEVVDFDKKSTQNKEINGIPVVGTLDTMFDYANQNVVDEVLIWKDADIDPEVVSTFISMGIVVHVCIRNMVHGPNATFNRLNGIPVVTASVNNVTTRQLAIKRLIDIFFGLAGSIVTLLLTIIIAPMMLIADPGPIFFRQERVGKNGRIFKIWKFRTMYKDAEARKAELMSQNKMDGLMFKMDDDPRIIGYGKKFSLGKFMRETSIDELPQSFNILAGSMSVVGTRPPTKNEYEQYQYHHKGRLAMMPGLTGMWQVSGRSDITDFEEIVELDKQYIENFSLMLDLEIILKTFKVVIGREGSV